MSWRLDAGRLGQLRRGLRAISNGSAAGRRGGVARHPSLSALGRDRLSMRRRIAGMPYEFERTQRIAILGGGPGGYEAALTGAQLGADVTLVERAGVGGAAVLTDVVPSKTLIATAEAATAVGEAADLGVQFFTRDDGGRAVRPEVTVNLGAVNKRLLLLARQQSEDLKAQLIEGRGAHRHRATAGSTAPNRLVVSTGTRQEAHRLRRDRGRHPRRLRGRQPAHPADREARRRAHPHLDAALHLDEVPEHLIVVGSGVTGAEFASAYRALGAAGHARLEPRAGAARTRTPTPPRDRERVHAQRHDGALEEPRRSRSSAPATASSSRSSDGRTVEGSHCLHGGRLGPEHRRASASRRPACSSPSRATSGSTGSRAPRCRRSTPPATAATSCRWPRSRRCRAAPRCSTRWATPCHPTELRNVTSNIFTQPEVATVGWSQKQIEDGHRPGRDLQAAARRRTRAPR